MGIGGTFHSSPSPVQGLDVMGSSLPGRHCAQGNLQNATSAASLSLHVPSLFRSRCTQDTLRLSKVLTARRGARQAVTRTAQTRLDRGAMWQRPRRAAPHPPGRCAGISRAAEAALGPAQARCPPGRPPARRPAEEKRRDHPPDQPPLTVGDVHHGGGPRALPRHLPSAPLRLRGRAAHAQKLRGGGGRSLSSGWRG